MITFNVALTALALSAQPAPTPSGAHKSAPVPATAADSVVTAAFAHTVDTPGEDQKGPVAVSSFSAQNLIAPVLALAGLGILALTVKRRRQPRSETIRIVGSTALGDKRSLVIADVLGERLVLGVSEAGVAVLLTKPTPEPTQQLEPLPMTLAERAPPVPSMGFFARLTGRPTTPIFDMALQESIEDQELRAKLAAGLRGVVP